MTNPLFTIQCPTCLAHLRVTRAEAVGAIWPCPKCGGLVHVAPPPGWGTSAVRHAAPHSQGADKGENPLQVGVGSEDFLPEGQRKSGVETSATPRNGRRSQVDGPEERPVPTQPASRGSETEGGVPRGGSEQLLPGAPGNEDQSPRNVVTRVWKCWSLRLITLVVTVSLALAVILWIWNGGLGRGPVQSEVVPQQGQAWPGEPVIAAMQSPEAFFLSGFPTRFSEVLYIDMRTPDGVRYARFLTAPWALGFLISWVDQVRQALGLNENSLAFVFVAGRDGRPVVCLFVLREDQDAEQLNVLGDEVSKLGAYSLRVFPTAPQPLAFCVVDQHNVLVSEMDHLRLLFTERTAVEGGPVVPGEKRSADNSGRWLAWLLLAPRLKETEPPMSWLQAWPELASRWSDLWSEGTALGWGWEVTADRLSLVVRWYTPDGETASALGARLRELQKEAGTWLDQGLSDETGRGWASFMGLEEACWEEHVTKLAKAVQAMEISCKGTWVEARYFWKTTEESSIPTNEIEEALRVVWEVKAAERWGSRQRELGKKLSAFVSGRREFPPAAAGGELLPPETRLSWIAQLLPYLGYEDWYRGLQSGYSWNASQNRAITQRFLPEVVNPLVGPTQSISGFFDTHIVGVTGIGPEAGYLPPSDRRAGVFNFRQPVKKDDILDGLSNTLAFLPVEQKRGPWGAGGRPTARGLTTRPYVGGPDGFGSGYPEGMLAVMADGSVRFIRHDVDPRVLEQLATIAGGEPVNTEWLGAPPGWDFSPGSQKETDSSSVRPLPPAVSGTIPIWPGEKLCGLERPDPSSGGETLDAILGTRLVVHQWPEMPLGLAMAILSEWTGIPVTLDPESMQWTATTAGTRVNIRPGEKTVQLLLEEIASQLGFRTIKCGQVIVLCAPERLQDHVVYQIKEMKAPVSLELLESISKSIWCRRPNGSGSPVKFEQRDDGIVLEGAFIPVMTIRDLLTDRESPQPVEEVSQSHEPDGEWVTLSIYEPSPIISIVAAINRLSPLQIIIDWPSLLSNDVKPDTPATVSSVNEPVLGVIQRCAQGLNGRAYWIDRFTIVIASRDRFERPTLRMYSLDPLLDKGLTPGIIREKLTASQPDSWAERGGVGRVFFTADGRRAIIYHTATGHRHVRDFLQSGWRTR